LLGVWQGFCKSQWRSTWKSPAKWPLNVPADHAVRGWIGRRWEERTDGWGIGDVPSRGAASRCRGVGYDEVSSFVLELISCERTWFVRFHVGLPSKIYKQKLVLIIRLKLETKYLSC
jgi:hypothetical protein